MSDKIEDDPELQTIKYFHEAIEKIGDVFSSKMIKTKLNALYFLWPTVTPLISVNCDQVY